MTDVNETQSVPAVAPEAPDAVAVAPEVAPVDSEKQETAEEKLAREKKLAGKAVVKETTENMEDLRAEVDLGKDVQTAAPVKPTQEPEPAPAPKPKPEKKGFFAKLGDGFNALINNFMEIKAKEGWMAAITSTGTLFGILLGGGAKDAKKGAEDVVEAVADVAKETAREAYAVPKKAVENAEKTLRKAVGEHSDWLGYAEEASETYGIPRKAIFAIAYFESRFNPGVANPDSSAEGLGQFIDKTWNKFRAATPEFSDAEKTDPRAMFHAIAWLARQSVNALGIDVNSPDLVKDLYMGHAGHRWFKKVKAYQENGTEFAPPDSYVDKTYLGVHIMTGGDYAEFLDRAATKVQTVADHFEKVLPDLEKLA